MIVAVDYIEGVGRRIEFGATGIAALGDPGSIWSIWPEEEDW